MKEQKVISLFERSVYEKTPKSLWCKEFSWALNNKKARTSMDQLWAQYNGFEDQNFLYNIPTQLNNCLWEMYIGCYLLNHQLLTNQRKSNSTIVPRSEGPDYITNQVIYVECLQINPGTYPNKPIPDGQSHNYPKADIQLRLTSAIDNKLKQYSGYSKKPWFDPDRPYILAFNTYLGRPVVELYNILFGIGNTVVNYQRNGLTTTIDSVQETTENLLESHNGSLVSKDLFSKNEFSFMSAIVFSNTPIINDITNSTNHLYIIYNPNAAHPINKNSFPDIPEYQPSERYVFL